MSSRIIVIDAMNIRSGGGLKHFSQFLHNSSQDKHNFKKLVVFGNMKHEIITENRDDIVLISNCFTNGNQLIRLLYQFIYISPYSFFVGADFIFVPGGGFFGYANRVIPIFQNLLPFTPSEVRRYKSFTSRLKFFILRLYQGWTFKRAMAVIYLSHYARSFLVDSIKLNIELRFRVISHGFEIEKIQINRVSKEISEYSDYLPFKLLYVSILSPYKNHFEVIKAVLYLRSQKCPIELILVGPDDNETLAELRKSGVLNDNGIKYLGELKGEDLNSVYSTSDAFIFASTCENLPIILLEAISYNLPIVAYSHGSTKEVLGINYPYYFNDLKTGSIVDAILLLVNNMSESFDHLNLLRENYKQISWKSQIDETWSFFNELTQ